MIQFEPHPKLKFPVRAPIPRVGMKVIAPPPNSALSPNIQSKKDGEGGTGQNAYENLHQDKGTARRTKTASTGPELTLLPRPNWGEDGPPLEVIQEVIEDFNRDHQVKASGLVAKLKSEGKIHRIALTDALGQELRVMPSDEFIVLSDQTREATSQSLIPMGLRRGKLLDQKA